MTFLNDRVNRLHREDQSVFCKANLDIRVYDVYHKVATNVWDRYMFRLETTEIPLHTLLTAFLADTLQ